MTAKTGSKKDLHSFLFSVLLSASGDLLAADRSASCHLMMSDSFMSQSAVKGGSLRDRQGMEREQAGEKEREKKTPTGTPNKDIYGRNTPTLKNKLVCKKKQTYQLYSLESIS